VSALPALLPSPADDLRDLVQRCPGIEAGEASRLTGWPRGWLPLGVAALRIRGRIYLTPEGKAASATRWYLYRGLDAAPLGPLTWGECVAAAGQR
jgi:hypothetical protein